MYYSIVQDQAQYDRKVIFYIRMYESKMTRHTSTIFSFLVLYRYIGIPASSKSWCHRLLYVHSTTEYTGRGEVWTSYRIFSSLLFSTPFPLPPLPLPSSTSNVYLSTWVNDLRPPNLSWTEPHVQDNGSTLSSACAVWSSRLLLCYVPVVALALRLEIDVLRNNQGR